MSVFGNRFITVVDFLKYGKDRIEIVKKRDCRYRLYTYERKSVIRFKKHDPSRKDNL